MLPETRYAKCGDVHVAYQVFGEGPVNLVYTPGFVSHIENYWDDRSYAGWLNGLARHCRVAMFDKRGTGLSDRVSHLPSMDERMEDLRVVMDAAGMDRAAVSGISEGGPLAMLFAASHPERCHSLILYGTFPRFSFWISTDEAFDGLIDYIDNHWGSGASLPMFAPSRQDDPAFQSWWGRFERLGASPSGAMALMRMNREIDITDVLPSIQVPTLIIHRSDDAVLDRVLATVLFTDIVGSTARAEALGDQRWRDLLDTHDAAVRRELERFRGNEVKALGDGFLATFDGPARAIRCALAINQAVRPLGLEVRSGLHTGEVELSVSDVRGIAVHIASRVAGLAGPGEAVVSRTVKDLVAGSGLGFEDFGIHRLTGVPDDWHLFRATG